MTPNLSRFVGVVEQDPESVCDLLPSTLDDTDSESESKGSYHLVRECNMLHLSENGATVGGGEEDDTYPIPRTPREQAEYEQEHLEQAKAREAEQGNECHNNRCPSP